MAYLAIFFIAAAAVLVNSYRWAGTPILRQQLKWITRGTILAITPFTLFYVIPVSAGRTAGKHHEGFRVVARTPSADVSATPFSVTG